MLTLPSVPTRPLSDYAIGGDDAVSTAPPPLAADLNDGLKRLKMAAMRRLAPELLVTAKTQRWNPEEFLRTLVEAEITARDESNARTRMRHAAFPVTKTARASSTSPRPRSPRRPSTTSPAGVDPRRGERLPDRPGRHRQVPRPGRARRRRGRGRAPGPVLHRRRARRNPLPGSGRQLRRPGHRDPAPQRPDHHRPMPMSRLCGAAR